MKHAVTLLAFKPGTPVLLSISRGDDLNDWGLIGGKVEPGETLLDALVREAAEEADLHLRHDCLHPVFTSLARTRLTTTFVVTEWQPPPKFLTTREGTVAWKQLWELCEPGCTYRDYNFALFKHLRLM